MKTLSILSLLSSVVNPILDGDTRNPDEFLFLYYTYNSTGWVGSGNGKACSSWGKSVKIAESRIDDNWSGMVSS